MKPLQLTTAGRELEGLRVLKDRPGYKRRIAGKGIDSRLSVDWILQILLG